MSFLTAQADIGQSIYVGVVEALLWYSVMLPKSRRACKKPCTCNDQERRTFGMLHAACEIDYNILGTKSTLSVYSLFPVVQYIVLFMWNTCGSLCCFDFCRTSAIRRTVRCSVRRW